MSRQSFNKKLTSFQRIIAGFLALIMAGTILLMLPAAVRDGSRASLEHALFTATSAVCVTGLVVQDTALYWSPFGQAVILILIQIGGLGVVSVAAFFAMISGRRISLLQRSMLQDTVSAHQIGGVVKMTGFIVKTALIAEAAGAVLMLPAFCGKYGAGGIWMSVFHSVSAFCNAGFDLMGARSGAYSSLTLFGSEPGIVLPVCILIIMGGIGFVTWKDIAENGLHVRRYRMQSKVVLTTTAALLLIPMIFLFVSEYAGYPLKERLCLSLFQAVTPRTAGFNTADLTVLSGTGRMLMILLMLTGGSPGSTAGGMKTTTVAVLYANAISVFRRSKNAQLYGRRIHDSTIKSASTLLMMYLILALAGAAVISTLDGLPLGTCLFETASAIGTVGLSLGITPALSLHSHLVLILLMFFGRTGGLTLMYAVISSKSAEASHCPVEKIIVG